MSVRRLWKPTWNALTFRRSELNWPLNHSVGPKVLVPSRGSPEGWRVLLRWSTHRSRVSRNYAIELGPTERWLCVGHSCVIKRLYKSVIRIVLALAAAILTNPTLRYNGVINESTACKSSPGLIVQKVDTQTPCYYVTNRDSIP